MTGRLLVSISSLFDATRPAVATVCSQLADRGVPVSLLVAPHIDGNWHLAKDPATLAFIQDHADGMILNGFDQAVQGRRAEFATLPAHEARLRLAGAVRQMHRLGLDTDMFAPPRWRLSEGTLQVVPQFGFWVVGSTKGVWYRDPAGRWALERGRNLSVGEGFGAPGWWRRNLITAARRGASRGNTVRLSASGRNLCEPEVARDFVAAVDAAVRAGAHPARYADFGLPH
ncbi:DUF2334 domain-containing protein [Corynebacterium uberis]|uniref:DUF2334 domain-containing protein n=1 Tax=Corynebacterium TaxID=1716 RepID=UPI001D0B13AA|nr:MULTISPECIES: DUF2334 domain-containing protein [Corynebacterium]MCZ9310293.1 DUF2334 domain-containing protein [Corynebacterium sp. c6VSa_13]UDL73638.1 DUF2334 domain-containing protein [Corynebacterium uberis]UDL75482.1 DUF2334 domain-containing protein [Corynebacterium uberis]UDL77695.1 DUF2334 domain-containing protein [Corynebacterium uberis]UDL79979.1 DUF2334 domain-containing protein [Corynebacterium uberis]